ncbi:MAG: hypothetical protein WD871_04600 [Xanthobacteraceae bacterium]
MQPLYDFHWRVEERSFPEYNAFVLLGSKGMALAYPTIPLRFPEENYSREEALLNATVAANAPYMLQLLETLASYMEVDARDDPTVKGWRDKILDEIAVATGEQQRA